MIKIGGQTRILAVFTEGSVGDVLPESTPGTGNRENNQGGRDLSEF